MKHQNSATVGKKDIAKVGKTKKVNWLYAQLPQFAQLNPWIVIPIIVGITKVLKRGRKKRKNNGGLEKLNGYQKNDLNVDYFNGKSY